MLSASLPHLLHAVASLADAWIKMVDLYEFLVQNHVAPLTGAWIKTGSIIVARKRMNVASLVDAWIKIKTGREPDIDWTRRIPRGCVD